MGNTKEGAAKRNGPGSMYVAKVPDGRLKIGFTTQPIGKRLADSHPGARLLMVALALSEAEEKALHRTLNPWGAGHGRSGGRELYSDSRRLRAHLVAAFGFIEVSA